MLDGVSPFRQNFLHTLSTPRDPESPTASPVNPASLELSSEEEMIVAVNSLLKTICDIFETYEKCELKDMQSQLKKKEIAVEKQKKIKEEINEAHKLLEEAQGQSLTWEKRMAVISKLKNATFLLNGLAAQQDGIDYKGLVKIAIGAFSVLFDVKDIMLKEDSYFNQFLTKLDNFKYKYLVTGAVTLAQFALTGGAPQATVAAILALLNTGLSATQYYIDHKNLESQQMLKEMEAEKAPLEYKLEKNRQTLKKGIGNPHQLIDVAQGFRKSGEKYFSAMRRMSQKA